MKFLKTELKSFSFKEKISIATICFSESMWEEGLSNLEQFRLHELFYNDYIEWQKLENHLSLEKETGGFDELFESRAEYEKFIKLLKRHNWIDKNNEVKIDTLFSLTSVLKFLKRKSIIRAKTDTEIRKTFEKTFNYEMSASSFSNGDSNAVKDFVLYNDLIAKFNIESKI